MPTMIARQNLRLNLVPGGVLPVLYASQYDSGYDVHFTLYNGSTPFDIPEDVAVRLEETKTDGYGFTIGATKSETDTSQCYIWMAEQMTAVAGDQMCELVLTNTAGRRIGTANFILRVEVAALSDDTVISDSQIAYASQVVNQLGTVAAYGEALNALKNNKVQKYDNVSQMVADYDLAPGMYALTGGHHSVNDHGKALYRIYYGVPSGHYETLSNGTYAALVTDGNVTPEMFGAVGDGVTDDTAAIQAALTSGCAVVFGQYRAYKITQDITFHTSLDLNFSTLKLIGCSLVVDDGQSTQQHYDFGIIIENGYFVGDNTNTLIEVKHATKATIENCAFKDFLTGILITTGYEHKINGCRFIGNPSVHATAIEKHDGDGFVIDVTGVDCYKAIVIQKAKHYINNIHFWILTPSLVDGSVMITYTGAGQSNLVIDYAYFDSYETGIYKSGLATLVLNSSNIIMPSSLWSGEYYLFEFGDANQNFLVTVNDFATPWSNETNFRISMAAQSAIFYFNLTKASYRIIDVVKDYINSQITFKNGITATGVDVTFDKNLMRFKAILTMPSTLPSGGTICMSIPGIRFPDQSIKLFGGQYGTEYMSFDYENAFIRNSAGQTIDVDVMVKYFPQYT